MKTLPFFVLALAIVAPAATPVDRNLDPTRSWPDNRPYYLADLEVISTVTRKELSVDEIMNLLDQAPNVKTVMLGHRSSSFAFNLENLCYPQYEPDYELTPNEWQFVQARCQALFNVDAGQDASPEVVAHWKSIIADRVPFGLRVQKAQP